jgi:hypothetical protein
MQYLRLHFAFLLNKYLILILLLLSGLTIIGLIYNSDINQGYSVLDLNRSEYEELFFIDSVELIKISGIILSILLAAFINSKANLNLGKYTIQSFKDKFVFVLMRSVSVLIILTLFYLNYWVSFILINNYFLPYNIIYDEIILVFEYLFIQMLIYFFITSILILFIKNFMIVIIPIIIFFISESNLDYETIKTVKWLNNLYVVVPNLVFYNQEYVLMYPTSQYFIVIGISFILYICIFLYSDVI